MPGPAPNPNRRRRNVGPPVTRLPAEGRTGDAPEWPLSRAKAPESRVWVDLWRLPQAVMWERLAWTRTVARYVRCLITVEGAAPSTRMLAEVRQLEDRLGLTDMALKRLGWEIARDELGEKREERESTRDRVKAVDARAVARS